VQPGEHAAAASHYTNPWLAHAGNSDPQLSSAQVTTLARSTIRRLPTARPTGRHHHRRRLPDPRHSAAGYRPPRPHPGALADTAIRVAAGLTTLGLMGIAGAISYQHLLTLAFIWSSSARMAADLGVYVVDMSGMGGRYV
jgi:hypothetical protein